MTMQIALLVVATALSFLQAITLYLLNDLRSRIARLEARAMGQGTGWLQSEGPNVSLR